MATTPAVSPQSVAQPPSLRLAPPPSRQGKIPVRALLGWSALAILLWLAHRVTWGEAFGLLLSGGAVIGIWARAHRPRRSVLACWLLSLTAATLYLGVTANDVRQYDSRGHQSYVRTILVEHRLPSLKEDWESYHPPAYYLAAAAWVAAVDPFDHLAPFGPTGLARELQALGWAVFLASIALAAWASRRLGPKIDGFVAFLFALLPSHLFFAARINNDAFLPICGTLVLVGLVAHARRPRRWVALAIGGLCLFAIANKLNGLGLWAGALACLCLDRRGHLPRRLAGIDARTLALVIVPSATFLAFWLLYSLRETGTPLYTNFPVLDQNLRVPNDAYRFLSFDFRAYLSQAGADTRVGDLRLSFPTFVAATALFGEFAFRAEWLLLITAVRAAFLPVLAMLAMAVASARRHWRDPLFRAAALLAAFQLAFLVALSVRQPASCSMDARYLAPAFLPLAILAGYGAREARHAQHLGVRAMARLGQIAFPALLAIFYVRLLFSS